MDGWSQTLLNKMDKFRVVLCLVASFVLKLLRYEQSRKEEMSFKQANLKILAETTLKALLGNIMRHFSKFSGVFSVFSAEEL